MFTTLRQVARQRALYIQTSTCSRYYATETNIPAASDVKEGESSEKHRYELFLERKAKEPPTRPQLKVGTDGKHGLYAFFRSVPTSDGTSTIFETVEASSKPTTKTGRAWNAVELRRKSFKDLHTLWYILLRERNLLATQRAEAKRLGIIEEFTDVKEKDGRCRKSMARIKQILNERRLAYEQAHTIAYNEIQYANEIQKAASSEAQAERPVESTATSSRGRRQRRGRPTISAQASTP